MGDYFVLFGWVQQSYEVFYKRGLGELDREESDVMIEVEGE